MYKLTAISLAGVLALSAGPAFTQDEDTRPAERTDSAGEDSGPPEDRAGMREMMREMMEEMMREAPRNGAAAEGRSERAERATGGRDARGAGQSRRDFSRAHRKGGEYSRMHRDRKGPRHHMGHDRRGDMGKQAFHGARMKIVFAIADANGDGELTIEEINDFHERIFNAVDRDGDGGVTPDEIRGFFHGGREPHRDREDDDD